MSGYDDIKGKSALWGEIARLRAALDSQIDTISGLGASVLERDAEIARLQAEVEQLRVQLAGCLTAAEGHTNDPATEGMYGWSPAYEAVLQLRPKWDKAEAVVRAAELCGKELRVAQAWVVNKSHKDQIESIVLALEKALAAAYRERA